MEIRNKQVHHSVYLCFCAPPAPPLGTTGLVLIGRRWELVEAILDGMVVADGVVTVLGVVEE
jgi:hypothetical protein